MPSRARACGMIDTGKHGHSLGLHLGLEPVHGIFRPVIAWDRRQSVCRHGALQGCPAAIRSKINELGLTTPRSFSPREPFGRRGKLFTADPTILKSCLP